MTVIFKPFIEGLEHLGMAHEGHDNRYIHLPEISSGQIVQHAVTGFVLILPFINYLFYACLYFLTPHLLLAKQAQPSLMERWREADQSCAREITPSFPPIPPEEAINLVRVKSYDIIDQEESGSETPAKCFITSTPDGHQVYRVKATSKIKATYTRSWNLLKYEFHNDYYDAHLTVTREGNEVIMKGTKRGGIPVDETPIYIEDYPLIMDPQAANRFIKSSRDSEITYAVHPLEGKLFKLETKKAGTEYYPGVGEVQKTVSHLLDEPLLGLFEAANGWFNAKTGEWVKVKFRQSANTWTTNTRVL